MIYTKIEPLEIIAPNKLHHQHNLTCSYPKPLAQKQTNFTIVLFQKQPQIILTPKSKITMT